MSIIQGTAKSGGTVAASFYDYPIRDSLRFDGSSYLSRTPSTAGNLQTWTWSGWVKRGSLGAKQNILNGGTAEVTRFSLLFNAANQLYILDQYGGIPLFNLITEQLFQDTSAWYHLVLSVDTTQATSTDRVKLYINGEQVTSFSTSVYPSLNGNGQLNTANEHRIGRSIHTTEYLDGYLTNIQFIDGQELDPYFFGEFKDNIWVPYNAFSTAGSGTATASDAGTATDSYGTNGFHLDFADSSNIGNDVSGNNNDWTVN